MRWDTEFNLTFLPVFDRFSEFSRSDSALADFFIGYANRIFFNFYQFFSTFCSLT